MPWIVLHRETLQTAQEQNPTMNEKDLVYSEGSESSFYEKYSLKSLNICKLANIHFK